MRLTFIAASLATIALAACGSPDTAEGDAATDEVAMDSDPVMAGGGESATATLMTADGTEVGTVTATGSAGGITVNVEAMNMEPGLHGVHIHETGSCSPDFAAAGGHWNPDSSTHGLEGDEGQHAGDMPNLDVGADGTGTLQYMLSINAMWDGLMDADGSAFIVHAGEDDQMTDPSGDSGDRVACGVFAAG